MLKSTSPSSSLSCSSSAAPVSISPSKETSNDSYGSDEVIDLHSDDNNKLSQFDTSLANGTTATGLSSPTTTPQSGAKNKKLFPQKLWDLINDERYNFCLRWSDDGQLVYLNRDEFEDSYLKSFENQFHTQKAISFVRQMNMYGFRKVDDCYYENDNFKRDCEHLLKNMIRKHPNKNQVNYTDISPYLYQQQQQQPGHSVDLSAVASQHVAASSLAALHNSQQHSFANIGRKQSYNYLPQQQSKLPTNYMLHNVRKESVEFNDDSTSSFGDICCNNAQGEPVGHPLERLESNLSNEILDCTNFKRKQSNQCQQQSQPQSVMSQQLNSVRQMNSNFMQTFQSPTQTNNHSLLNQVGDLSQLLSQFKDNQLLHNTFLSAADLKQSTTNVNDGNDELGNMSQLQNQHLYYNQHELIRTLLDTQLQSSNNHGQGPNLVGLNPLLALISSMNSNMYQSSSPIQANHQNINLDRAQTLNLQQLYQSISPPGRSTDSQNLVQDLKVSKLPLESTTTTRFTDKLGPQTSLLRKDITPAKEPTRMPGQITSMMEETRTTNGHDMSKSSSELSVDFKLSNSDTPSMRRDTKSNRSFKRSVDSILDSNNNNPVLGKKVKLDETLTAGCDRLNAKTVNKNAKNLVNFIASSRDAKLDPDVITEASKYTERFVETLFDTAQVIARHSNGSSSTDQTNQLNDNTCQNVTETEKESRNSDHNQPDRSIINLSDLTSALKLLPSKILKILE